MKSLVPSVAEFTNGSAAEISLALATHTLDRDTGSLAVGFASVVAGPFGYVVSTNDVLILHEPGAYAVELRDFTRG